MIIRATILLVVFGFILSGCGIPLSCGDKTGTGTVVMTNLTSSTIADWYIKPSDCDDWGKDDLPALTFVQPNESYTIYDAPCDQNIDMKVTSVGVTIGSTTNVYMACGGVIYWNPS